VKRGVEHHTSSFDTGSSRAQGWDGCAAAIKIILMILKILLIVLWGSSQGMMGLSLLPVK
jgi:hypothetical protein